MEVIKYAQQGKDVIMIGHKNHPEVEGTLGRFPLDSSGKIHLKRKGCKINKNKPTKKPIISNSNNSLCR